MSGMGEGRVCIVTGAGRGIGREHALMLASGGAEIVCNGLRGAVELSEDRGPLCGVTRARNVVCDGDRRRYEDDPRRGPFVQALEPIAAKSSLTQRFGLVFVLAADGTVFVSGASAYMGELGRLPTRSDVPVPLGNVATAPPP